MPEPAVLLATGDEGHLPPRSCQESPPDTSNNTQNPAIHMHPPRTAWHHGRASMSTHAASYPPCGQDNLRQGSEQAALNADYSIEPVSQHRTAPIHMCQEEEQSENQQRTHRRLPSLPTVPEQQLEELLLANLHVQSGRLTWTDSAEFARSEEAQSTRVVLLAEKTKYSPSPRFQRAGWHRGGYNRLRFLTAWLPGGRSAAGEGR